MENLYFVCHWIIRSHPNYRVLINVANELNCELVIMTGDGDMKTSDGYLYFDFMLKVNSSKTLNEFIERAGRQEHLTEWIPTLEEYYSHGRLLAKVLDINTSSPLMLTTWLDTVSMMRRVNEMHDQKLKRQK